MRLLRCQSSQAGLWLSLVACLIFVILSSIRVWPPLDGDASAYFSPAVELSLGRSFANPVWLPPLNDTIDGPGGTRYIYHGFLYPLTIGCLAKIFGGGPSLCLFWMHLFNLLAAGIASLGLWTWCNWSGFPRIVLGALLPISIFNLCESLAGRPEPMLFLLAGLALFIAKRTEGPKCHLALSTFSTAAFFTSPAVGVLAFLALIYCIQLRVALGWRIVFSVMIGACLSFSLLSFIYPYSLADWFWGVWRHSKINLGLPPWQGFLSTWVGRPQTPFAILSFGVPFLYLLSCVPYAIRNLNKITQISCLLIAGLFVVGIVRTSFVKSEAYYNAVVWIPVLAVALISSPCKLMGRIWLISLLFLAVGFGRQSLILFHQFREGAVSYQEIQNLIRDKTADGIEISSGLFMAADNPKNVFFNKTGPAGSEKKLWVVLQQSYRGQEDAPSVPGYELIKTTFSPGIRWFDLRISRTPGGWEYAVYRRTD